MTAIIESHAPVPHTGVCMVYAELTWPNGDRESMAFDWNRSRSVQRFAKAADRCIREFGTVTTKRATQ